MDDKSKIIVSALAGAVVGAGVALLLAPQSGKETRDQIAQKLADARDATKDALGNARDATRDAIGNARDATRDAIGNAKDAVVEKGDELLKKAHSKS